MVVNGLDSLGQELLAQAADLLCISFHADEGSSGTEPAEQLADNLITVRASAVQASDNGLRFSLLEAESVGPGLINSAFTPIQAAATLLLRSLKRSPRASRMATALGPCSGMSSRHP